MTAESPIGTAQPRSFTAGESYDIRFRRSDGSVVWALISGSPFYDDAGRFAGSLGLLTDITARKRYEQGLIEAKEKAEELAHLKSALLPHLSPSSSKISSRRRRGCHAATKAWGSVFRSRNGSSSS